MEEERDTMTTSKGVQMALVVGGQGFDNELEVCDLVGVQHLKGNYYLIETKRLIPILTNGAGHVLSPIELSSLFSSFMK